MASSMLLRLAREVVKLHEILNHPGDEYFAVLLDSGEFINCPYTSRDLRTVRFFPAHVMHA